MRPRSSENLGAAARALKNFGLTTWTWVEAWADADEDARKLAVHATDVLESATRAATLDEAVADCAWVVATSSRRIPGKRSLSPRAFASEAQERIDRGELVSLVFGDERSGLRNSEVERCHDLSSVPTAPEQPSINLAQSILLYAYELHLAALDAAPPSADALPRAATDSDLQTLRAATEAALQGRGFLPQDGRHALNDLLSPLTRSRLTQKEANLWRAAMHALRKGR